MVNAQDRGTTSFAPTFAGGHTAHGPRHRKRGYVRILTAPYFLLKRFMASIRSWLLQAVLLGLLGAGIVHIVILLLLPSYSPRDLWDHFPPGTPFHQPVRMDESATSNPLATLSNPFFAAIGCRFDLSEGPLQIRAERRVPFWSMSIFDRSGPNVFSLTDRAMSGPMLDLVVASPAQLRRLRQGLSPEFKRSVFVETAAEQGVALLRVFVPDETWTDAVNSFIADVTCETRPLMLD